MYSRKISKLLLSSLIIASSLMDTNVLANNTNSISSYIHNSQNFIDLGTIKEYDVDTTELVFASRDYSKAYKVFNGTKISEPGTYRLRFKDSDKVIGFEINSKVDYSVSNDQELKEVIRYALSNMEESVTVKLKGGYLNNFSSTPTKISKLINEVVYQYPLITYNRGSVGIRGNELRLVFQYPMEKNKGLEVTKKIEDTMEKYINSLDLTLNDIELQKQVIYDILDYVEYDEYSANIKDVPMAHFVQGLNNGNKKLVCDGYSKVFMSIANTLGIPTQLIVGVSNGQDHAWNIVNHNGQNYHVDVTWADSEYRLTDYVNYVNEKDNFMERTHEWDRAKYPVCNMNDYINTKIYDCIDIEDFKKSKEIDRSKSIIADINNNSALQDIVDKYNRGIAYIKYDKYGKSIITVTK